MVNAHAYEIDGQPCSAAVFTAHACDPRRSVVVEACAGSGKTWLLVARMLRLLLDGAAPGELLAITFTRKAAQEMRERLFSLLRELALADDARIAELLRERGVTDADLAAKLPLARGLYQAALASPQALAIDTFHSWFGRLLQLAPLTAGVPHGYSLSERTGELLREAWGQLMQMLALPAHAALRQALLVLYDTLGDYNARQLIDAFADKRAEWWAANRRPQAPLEVLRALCGEDGEDGVGDVRLGLWDDGALCQRLETVARILGGGGKLNQDNAVKLERGLSQGRAGAATLENFELLCSGLLDKQGKPRSHGNAKALQTSIATHWGAGREQAFADECAELAQTLLDLQARSQEPLVLAINQALFEVGTAYLECFQKLKADARVFDFSDLEWQAWRLLDDEEHAAYLHSRLDARYKHILLDEFQDTNPLQWDIVQAWLRAYGAAAAPSVFIVGDPKQSIYRFRRAEPRVFQAAAQLLQAGGAHWLRTNQTRRNAPAIVEALNQGMQDNPLCAPQTTTAPPGGMLWRLALVDGAAGAGDAADAADAAAPRTGLRDPLCEALPPAADEARLQEGRQVAQALWQVRAQHGTAWPDMMLLVRRRSHLGEYERALREAGIPYVSNRRGGLLDALEVLDLTALLNFLITPGDDRALAHVLKSPVMGCSDADLIALAQRDEASWWLRLQALADMEPGAALQRAQRLLQGWMQAAHDLPVHDLLDRILHQGDVPARYAQTVPPAQRGQVLGNLAGFTALALDLDGGRYPSLPKFIAALAALRRTEAEAPDESSVDDAADAVRILTIHSAKGLEADVVVLLDANHSEAAPDHAGVLCQWPLQAGDESHFSVFGRRDQRGRARDALFAREQAQADQENWNLLYVALTRARRMLIVSGVASARARDSWYQRLLHLPQPDLTAAVPHPSAAAAAWCELADFVAPDLALPAPPAAAPTAEQSEGIALHSLLERLNQSAPAWPAALPQAQQIANWLPCAPDVAEQVATAARAILHNPALRHFFDPALFVQARDEMEIVSTAGLLRVDRLVVLKDEIWVLDYKRALHPEQRAAYRAQLLAYLDALQSVYPGQSLRGALVLYDGSLVDLAEL